MTPAPPTPLAIIGGGHMAQAILAGGHAAAALDPAATIVAEPDPAKHPALAAHGIHIVATAAQAAQWLLKNESAPGQGQILLAIKPQMLAPVAADLSPILSGIPRIVITILAGTPSATVRSALGPATRVVRAMPNLAARIRRGATALCLGDGALPGDDAFAQQLFRAVGHLVVPLDESMMDAFTALAGSGPAYVFYLAEAMVSAAVEVGFDEPTAIHIVRETIAGAGGLLAAATESPAALRAAVTSKGGTTEAAARVLDHARVHEAITQAITAARDRGRELSNLAK
jgi:pyrroline-5-carboxylate reductase